MTNNLKIPKYAKEIASKALIKRNSLPDGKKFGLNKTDANKLGINSGVERAKQIVNNNYLPYKDAKRVCAFNRWTNRPRTEKIQGAIDLWGGDKFINKVCKHIKR